MNLEELKELGFIEHSRNRDGIKYQLKIKDGLMITFVSKGDKIQNLNLDTFNPSPLDHLTTTREIANLIDAIKGGDRKKCGCSNGSMKDFDSSDFECKTELPDTWESLCREFNGKYIAKGSFFDEEGNSTFDVINAEEWQKAIDSGLISVSPIK